MPNYYLTSFFIHAGVLILLYNGAPVNKGGADKISVNIVERQKFRPQPPILKKNSVSRKYAKTGTGKNESKKETKVDLNDYANQLKAIVDPIWVSKMQPLNLPPSLFLSTIVLIFPDLYGRIVSVKIIKSSGSKDFDRLALDAVREAGSFPKPPDSLIKDGIEWNFSNGGN